MIVSRYLWVAACAVGLFVTRGGADDGAPGGAPVAKRVPKEVVQHGERRVDDYAWLRNKEDPAVIKYLEAENAHTAAVMAPAKGLEEKLFKEIVGRLKEDDQEVPYRKGNWVYYSRTAKGKQYPTFCRRRHVRAGDAAAPEPAEQVTLDLNSLAEGKQYYDLGASEVSDDGNLIAYAEDVAGSREFKLRVKDLRSGKTLGEKIDHVSGIKWAADGRTIFYTLQNEAKRSYRLMAHALGTPAAQDRLVYEEKDAQYELGVGRTRSGRFLVVTSASKTTAEARVIPADKPDAAPVLVAARREGHEYYVDEQGGQFYVRTNDKGPNFRLVRVAVGDPREEKWEEVLPHRDAVVLENAECFESTIALFERAEALPGLRLMNPRTGKVVPVAFPEKLCAVGPGANAEYATTAVRVEYQSMVTPRTVYDVDLGTGALALLKRREVLGGYDPAKYVTERVYATAGDGARVPVSMVRRKDYVGGGPRPMLLDGYGAYGYAADVYFSAANLALLDRGVTVAMAHPRGGGDFGRRWYDAGRMANKPNTFTDFIACADYLVNQGYTTRDTLAIEGASAGGLLVGAVLNSRPDLCRVAVMEMPFVDMLNTMSDETLPLTTQEYAEWGNPNVRAEYEWIKGYCPYTNLGAKAYPAMLVRTGINDAQVMFHEPAKYVARMRAVRTERGRTLLLKVNMGSGHGGASGRYDAIREIAFHHAFVLRELGVER